MQLGVLCNGRSKLQISTKTVGEGQGSCTRSASQWSMLHGNRGWHWIKMSSSIILILSASLLQISVVTQSARDSKSGFVTNLGSILRTSDFSQKRIQWKQKSHLVLEGKSLMSLWETIGTFTSCFFLSLFSFFNQLFTWFEQVFQ